MKDRTSVESALSSSIDKFEILNYYTFIDITSPYIINGFEDSLNNVILGQSPPPYTLEQIRNHGGKIHKWIFKDNVYVEDSYLQEDDFSNNCFEVSTTTELNKAIDAKIDYPVNSNHDGDCDYFKFEIPQQMHVSIFTLGTTDTHGSLFHCCDNDISQCLMTNNSNSGENKNFRIDQMLEKGDYYLKVRHEDKINGFGNYQLLLQTTSDGFSDDYDATIISQSYGNGNEISCNELFTEKIKLKNTGNVKWDTNFKFSYISGKLSINQSDILIDEEVNTNEEYTIDIAMKAPFPGGTYEQDGLRVYTEEWELISNTGVSIIKLSTSIKSKVSANKAYYADSSFLNNGWSSPTGISTFPTNTNYDFDSKYYPINHNGPRHGGIDIKIGAGNNIYSIASGIIKKIRISNNMNTYIVISHKTIDGTIFYATYGHVKALDTISVDDCVNKGQLIGKIVSAGSPDHIHFSINTLTTTPSPWYGQAIKTNDPMDIGFVDPITWLKDHFYSIEDSMESPTESMIFLNEKGIMENIDPNLLVSRKEAWTMIFRTLKDINQEELLEAHKVAITNQQNPDCLIDRQELIVMIIRALSLYSIEFDAIGNDPFDDISTSPYREYILKAFNAKIMDHNWRHFHPHHVVPRFRFAEWCIKMVDIINENVNNSIEEKGLLIDREYDHDSIIEPELDFTQKFTIKNDSNEGYTWDSNYKLTYIKGHLSKNHSDIRIQGNIHPGESYTFKIPMRSPERTTQDNTYLEEWHLISSSGETIKINNSFSLLTIIKIEGLEPPSDCSETLVYDQEIIIPDNEIQFVDIPPSMIQQFLVDKGSVLKDLDLSKYILDPKIKERNDSNWSQYVQENKGWYLDELDDDKPTTELYSPAELIYYVAKEAMINPILLLSYLQKEQGLITRTSHDNLQNILNRATGYGMAEGGDINKYYGFFAQIDGLAYEIKKETLSFGTSYADVIDGTTITIRTAFAHFHYDYTPHFKSASDLFSIYSSYRRYFMDKQFNVCNGSLTNLIPGPFPDVSGEYWASKYITYAKENGIINGYENGFFGPEDTVKRKEVLKMLYKTANLPEPDQCLSDSESGFSDVGMDDWWCKYTKDAVKNGYISTDNDKFRPHDPISRTEALKMLVQVFNVEITEDNGSYSYTINDHPIILAEDERRTFKDVPESDWSYKYINFLSNVKLPSDDSNPIEVSHGSRIIEGYRDSTTQTLTGYFGPKDNLLRSQMAKIVVGSQIFFSQYSATNNRTRNNSLINQTSSIGYLLEQNFYPQNNNPPEKMILKNGNYQRIGDNEIISINGDKFDADGDRLFYFWNVNGGTFKTTDPINFSEISWKPPKVENETTFQLNLVRGDYKGYVRNNTYYITVFNTDDIIAPNDISNFQVTSTNNSAQLNWTKPSDTDLTNILIVRSTSPITWKPVNGQSYYGKVSDENDVDVIYDFHGSSNPDFPLNSNATYYYKAFAYDNNLNYSDGVSSSVTTGEIEGTPMSNLDGTLTENMTLHPQNNPYVIKSGLTVPAGIILTIEPGTIIKVQGSSSYINIYGTLLADGTPDNPIILTSINNSSICGKTGTSNRNAGDWGHIKFLSGSTASLKYATIEYAGGNTGTHTSSIHIYSSPIFENVVIRNIANKYNSSYVARGIYIYGTAAPIIKNCVIENVENWGIYSQTQFPINLSYNAILNNAGGVYSTASTITATNVDWGHDTGPYHAQINPNGQGNKVSDNIIFDTWLNTDNDNDNIPTAWEWSHGLDPFNSSDADDDNDFDGLSNLKESQFNTNPFKADTDNDRIPDKWEIENNLNPLSKTDASEDFDNDGVNNLYEYISGTNPNDPNSKKILGDINGDGKVTLWDAIVAIQQCVCINSVPINLQNDVNGDGKIGLEEVMYIIYLLAVVK